jgi:hypothetical protein
MRRALVLLLIVLVTGCGKPPTGKAVTLFTCDDGSRVVDMSRCPKEIFSEEQVRAPVEPDLAKVLEPEAITGAKVDQRASFDKYAENRSYKFVSGKQIIRDGTEYYRIKYWHNNSGGGNSYAIVDSQGVVYQELGRI